MVKWLSRIFSSRRSRSREVASVPNLEVGRRPTSVPAGYLWDYPSIAAIVPEAPENPDVGPWNSVILTPGMGAGPDAGSLLGDCRARFEKTPPCEKVPSNDPFPETQEILLEHGRIVWGCVAQANNALFRPGTWNRPAATIYSPDPYFDDRPDLLQLIARSTFAVKQRWPEDREIARISTIMRKEHFYPSNEPLPPIFSNTRSVVMTTTSVHRRALPTGRLTKGIYPLLICPEHTKDNMVLPLSFWAPDLARSWTDTEEERSSRPDEEQMTASDHLERLEYIRARDGRDNPTVAVALDALATHRLIEGAHTEAMRLFCEALTLRRKRLGDDHLDVAVSLRNLAGGHLVAGDIHRAEQAIEEALIMVGRMLGPEHIGILEFLETLSHLRRQRGDVEGAHRMQKQVSRLYLGWLGVNKEPDNGVHST
ncbi:MAG: tetratricopeptide repeat protein [Planctomycetota bacterium]|jgi:hypothetical protein